MSFLPAVVRRRYLGPWFLGVCSTLGRWTGVGPLAFRAALVYGLVFHTTLTIATYVALGIAGRLFKITAGENEGLMRIEKSSQPSAGLEESFADLNVRLARLEAEALSADAVTRARFRSAGF